MAFFETFSKKIEAQDWDHTKFIQNVLIMMVLVILFFYIFVLITRLNGLVDEDYFNRSLLSLLRGNVLGIISGIIINFIFLGRYYLNQEWDLHVVIPSSLFFHVVISIIIFISFFLTDIFEILFETAFITGFLLGGLIPMLAYSGEVDKEHSGTEEKIVNSN